MQEAALSQAGAGTAATRGTKTPRSLAPDRTERVLGWLAVAMLAVVLTAIARGYGTWHRVPWTIWVHLATMATALALTPAILWHPRGNRRHRALGYAWVASLAVTAILSFWIRTSHPGHLSWIHVISAWVLVMLPVVVLTARSHDVRRHRRAVRGLAIGALLVAGFFTFPFGRLLGDWLFGVSYAERAPTKTPLH